MANGPTGKLELTWANKDRRLIGDDQGGYRWVPANDHRVREVRLLRSVGAEGVVHPDEERVRDNLLIHGDALHALTSMCELSEFGVHVGKVKLAYIDPPFNTGQAFEHYDDGLEHSVWLTMIRDRLIEIRRLLSPEGSVWVHLDDAEMAYCRVLLDEVFGRENFVATVVWEKADSPRNSARYFSTDQDYILVFAKDAEQWVPNRLPRTDAADAIYSNPDDDARGPWLPGDPYANKPYSRGTYTLAGPTGREFSPPPGRFWRVSEERLRELDEDGRVWWGPNRGARPSIKRYLSEVADLVPRTLWRKDEVGSNRTSKNEMRALFPEVESFATPKPERLMARIIHISTEPDDLVLDCFAGSATTAAVAHKMGRRWITVEWQRSTIETFAHPRLAKVMQGADPGGITKDVGWLGGGGFRVLDVGPSMYEEDAGTVVLAEWATNHALAEATAAQLGFDYEVDGPFCGRRGRTRLAALDGMLTRDAVEFLVSSLPPRETLSAVGVGVEPEVDAYLQKLRPGSRARTAPQDLLLAYATPSAWRIATVERSDAQVSIFDPEIEAEGGGGAGAVSA